MQSLMLRDGRMLTFDDVEQLADHLGLDRFAVAGASAGGPNALAVAHVSIALRPDPKTSRRMPSQTPSQAVGEVPPSCETGA